MRCLSGYLLLLAMILAWMNSDALAGYVTTVLDDPDLIAYYRLNETAGTVAVEQSGNASHDGSYVGSIPGDNMAGPGAGSGFRGLDASNTAPDFSSDSVLLPDAPFDQNVISVTGFFKTSSHSGSWRRLYTTSDASTNQLAIMANGDDFLIHTGPYAGRLINNVAALTDNAWHHLVLTRDGSTSADTRVYVDGEYLPSVSTSNAGYDPGTWIGNRGTSTDWSWWGGLDEVAFFGREMDRNDVDTLYYQAKRSVGNPFAFERFTYGLSGSPVELDGQNGGLGWASAWTADTGITEVVDPGTPLQFGNSEDTPLYGGDRALRLDGNSQSAATRSLDATYSGDEVYVSFLLRWDEGTVDDNDFAALFFGTGEPSIGVKGNKAGGGLEDFYVRLGPGGEQYSSEIADNSTTHLIVGRLFKDSGTGNYDRFSLWVDPDWDDLHAPDVTATGDAGFASFSAIGIKGWNLDANDSVLFDELRLGRTWGDVMPLVPEPSTLLLLLLGGTALMPIRRRRRRRNTNLRRLFSD